MKIENTLKEVVTKTITGNINVSFTPEEFCYFVAFSGNIPGTGKFRDVVDDFFYNAGDSFIGDSVPTGGHENDASQITVKQNSYKARVEFLLKQLKVK